MLSTHTHTPTHTHAHPKKKAQEICRNFQRTGRCRFGSTCRHKHEQPQPCLNFEKTGKCLNGRHCRHSHTTLAALFPPPLSLSSPTTSTHAAKSLLQETKKTHHQPQTAKSSKEMVSTAVPHSEHPVLVNHCVNDHSAAASGVMAQIKPFIFQAADVRSLLEIQAEQIHEPVKPILPPICPAFRNTGLCQKGHDCQLRHTRQSQTPKTADSRGKKNAKATAAAPPKTQWTPVQHKEHRQRGQHSQRRSHLSENRHPRLQGFFDNAKFVKKKVKKAPQKQVPDFDGRNAFGPLQLTRQNSSAG